MGFFETFNYSRDAKTNLVNYDMKFIIIKQYEFNNGDDPNKYVPTTPTVTPAPAPAPQPPQPSYDTYVIQNGDILEIITSRYYDYANYSELRSLTGKLATFNNMWDADSIYPGQVIKLPAKSVLLPLAEKSYNGIPGDGH